MKKNKIFLFLMVMAAAIVTFASCAQAPKDELQVWYGVAEGQDYTNADGTKLLQINKTNGLADKKRKGAAFETAP